MQLPRCLFQSRPAIVDSFLQVVYSYLDPLTHVFGKINTKQNQYQFIMYNRIKSGYEPFFIITGQYQGQILAQFELLIQTLNGR